MHVKTRLVGVAVATCVVVAWPSGAGAQGAAQADAPKSKEALALIASAMKLARNDLVMEAQVACSATGPARPPDSRPLARVEPVKIFDNFYYIGFEQIGAWVLRTTDGLVLFDTLNTPQEAEEVLEPGMRQLGLDPASIRYIVLSHGHRDHFGGAPYFQQKYGTRVLMTAADWDLIARPNARGGGGNPQPLPKRDMEIIDGQKLTVGDAAIMFGIAPGHTPGTIIMAIPVVDHGRPRVVMIPGGALQVPDRASYLRFERVINEYMKPSKPEMVATSHPMTMSNGLAQMDQIRKNPNGPNPFLYTQEQMARYLDIMLLCRKAWVVEKEGPF